MLHAEAVPSGLPQLLSMSDYTISSSFFTRTGYGKKSIITRDAKKYYLTMVTFFINFPEPKSARPFPLYLKIIIKS